jgi:hypothetical protein
LTISIAQESPPKRQSEWTQNEKSEQEERHDDEAKDGVADGEDRDEGQGQGYQDADQPEDALQSEREERTDHHAKKRHARHQVPGAELKSCHWSAV